MKVVQNEFQALQTFVSEYFKNVGGSFTQVSPGVYRAELSKAAAAELDGSPWTLWTNNGHDDGSHVTYYFTFEPSDSAGEYDAQLVTPGSHRFEQILSSTRKMSRAFRAWLPVYGDAEKHVRYRPFFLFLLRTQFQGQTAARTPYIVAVDRVDEIALPQMAALLPRLPLISGQPAPSRGSVLEEPAISLALGFAMAFDELLLWLRDKDPSWAHLQRNQLETEKRRLAQFYSRLEHENTAEKDQERERRLREIDEMMPRVRVDILSVGDIYLPVKYREDGSLHHLAFDFI